MQSLKSKTRLRLMSVLHSCEIYLFSVWGSNVLLISQGNCGSSYAFSATGSIEGAVALGYGYLERLSEQNLIDCSSELEICSILCAHYVRTMSCQTMKENSLSSQTPICPATQRCISHFMQSQKATMAAMEGTCTTLSCM